MHASSWSFHISLSGWLIFEPICTINRSNVQNRLGGKILLHPSMSTLCMHLQWTDGADQSTSICVCRYPWRRQLVLNILDTSCKCTNCELTEHLLYALHTKWHAGNSSQLWHCFKSYTGVWTFFTCLCWVCINCMEVDQDQVWYKWQRECVQVLTVLFQLHTVVQPLEYNWRKL